MKKILYGLFIMFALVIVGCDSKMKPTEEAALAQEEAVKKDVQITKEKVVELVAEKFKEEECTVDKNEIEVIDIAECKEGFLTCYKYNGEGAYFGLGKIKLDNQACVFEEIATGEINLSAGICINQKVVDDQVVIWGDVGSDYFVGSDQNEQVDYSKISFYDSNKFVDSINVKNNTAFLLVENMVIDSWEAYDSTDQKIIDSQTLLKSYGETIHTF